MAGLARKADCKRWLATLPGAPAPLRPAQVWCRSNWHWYLKQELRYPNAGSAGVTAAWDEEAPRVLRVLSANGGYHRLSFGWGACVSANGTAAVVDGHQLLLTPLRWVRLRAALRALMGCWGFGRRVQGLGLPGLKGSLVPAKGCGTSGSLDACPSAACAKHRRGTGCP